MDNLGLFDLFDSFSNSSKPPDINTCPGLTDPTISGILLRQTAATLEPTDGKRDWSWMDKCVAACVAHNKFFSVQLLFGQGCPSWFYTKYPNEILPITGDTHGPTSVCFGPGLQSYLGSVQTDMSARYKSNTLLRYVVMSLGKQSESFVAQVTTDDVALTALAKKFGYSSGSAGWQDGAQKVTDIYMSAWGTLPCTLVTGTPCLTGGTDAMLATYTNMHVKYGSRLGCRPDSLTSRAPSLTEPAATYMQICKDSIGTGLQFGSPQLDPVKLQQAFDHAVALGAHYVEMFESDMTPNTAAIRATALKTFSQTTLA